MNELKSNICLICGVKNVGKTTLIEKLIRELSSRGLKTAVIKHDGHDFTCDVPGTDSSRFYEAGAYGTAVFSKNRMFIHRAETQVGDSSLTGTQEEHIKWETERTKELAGFFPTADLILVEGLKNTHLPKIEILRKEVSDHPSSNPDGRFLIVTDLPAGQFAEDTANFSEIEKIADLIEKNCRSCGQNLVRGDFS